ncbi:FHA domain-containing protein [Herbiconiux sp. 11R-BC]|uniref:FHA domain-containing protein n=1 Tax=Herbiconiux sp. 11R-BC TaxID=3111637 RepID=UPI003C03B3F9
MTDIRYRAGAWRAAVTPNGFALLPDTLEADMIGRVWDALRAGRGLAAVLETLTGAFGTSLAALPPFAVAAFAPGEARLAVRGPLEIDVTEAGAGASDAPGYTVSGADVTTWSERVVRNPATLDVRIHPTSAGTAAAPIGAGEWFGLADAVVLCDALAVAFSPGGSTAHEPETAADAPALPPTATTGSPEPDTGTDASPAPAEFAASLDATIAASGTATDDFGSRPSTVTEAPGPRTATTPSSPNIEQALAAPARDAPGDGLPEQTIVEETLSEGAAPGKTAVEPGATESIATEGGSESAHAGETADSSPEHGAARTAGRTQHSEALSSADEHEPIDEVDGHTRAELPDDAYDHLWGATVVKSVEDAAVRETDDEEETDGVHPASASAPPALPPGAATGQGIRTGSPAVSANNGSGSGPAHDDAHAAAPAPGTAAAADGGFAPPSAPVSDPRQWTAPPATGLIDSVPGFGSLGASSSTQNWGSPRPAPEPAGEASAPPPPPPSAAPPAPRTDDDHDGLTVTVGELEAMRRLAEAQAAAPAGSGAAAPTGRMILSTGDVYPLTGPLIIGRRPRATRVAGDQVPVLVTVESPQQDISRSHLEVRIEGRHVLAVDLDTTNGSVLHRAGTPPLRLSPHDPVLLLSGDIVDLGDGVNVVFEELS